VLFIHSVTIRQAYPSLFIILAGLEPVIFSSCGKVTFGPSGRRGIGFETRYFFASVLTFPKLENFELYSEENSPEPFNHTWLASSKLALNI